MRQSVILAIAFFAIGLSVRDIGSAIFPSASAEVAGMNQNELRRDRDFRLAVEVIARDVVSSCTVYVYDGENGNLYC